jgi:Tfp pilus assembly protein PilN
MRALDLDFRRESRYPRWVGMALLVAGVAGTIAAGVQYSHLAREYVQAEASLQQAGSVVRRQSLTKQSSGDPRQLALEMKRAREVAFALRLPWNDLFASVEAANTAHVALLSIESETGKRQVRITGEAKDLEALLDYLRLLGTQPKLANAYLQSHQVQEQHPYRPVRFVLGVDWVSSR